VSKCSKLLLAACCLALTAALASAQNASTKSTVKYPSAFAVSRPLSQLPIEDELASEEMEAPRPLPIPMMSRGGVSPAKADPVLQKENRPFVSATQGLHFDGVGAQGFAPSDVNLAVGPNHIVQTVNVRLAVYNKSGTLLSGPTNFTTFFAPLGGNCAAGASDPIVNYDRLADRWVISDIGITGTFSQCVAVSKTNDPTGAYTLYAYSFGLNLNDYPKLGVWPTASNSAYLATYNIFRNGQSFNGADLCGFDRTKMLAGNASAAQLCVLTPNTEGGYLPSDLDGPTPPTNGTPGLFLTWQNNNPGQLFLRKLTLDFTAGTASLSSPTTIAVANTTLACGNGGTCVPQKGTTQTLDTLGDRLMYRMAYRKFPDHERVVVNHSVGSGSQVAIRWYEILDPSGAVTLNQQGTFAPDSTYRWMASAAMDKSNDIAVGYSASSSTINPAIRFSGRVPSDPSGTLQSEASILEGSGSQTTGLSRWGDYTALQVDPGDDCTFWYTNQYQKTSGTFNWSTHIGSFIFTACGGGTPDFTLNAVPNTLTISLGSSGTSTLTVVPLNGFSDSVTLSASGLPSGVTAGFSPNPATSTSTLTLTASATATTGASTVTVSGVSGSLNHQTTLSLTVTGSGGPVVTLVPTSLTWGKKLVGTSGTKTVTLTNTGTATLNIGSLAITGSDFTFKTVTKPCTGSIAAGAFCYIKVTFTPSQVGLRTGNVAITDNAANSPQVIPLAGTGK